MLRYSLTCLWLLAAMTPLHAASAPRANLAVLQQKHQERFEQFAQAVEHLARECEAKGLTDAAKQVREAAVQPDGQTLQAEPLPKDMQPPIPDSLPADERYWRTQLRHLQTEYAQNLYTLSRQVLHAGSASYAYTLIREVTLYNPDHSTARKMLGYVRSSQRTSDGKPREQWVTPFEAQMLRKNFVSHEDFGWLPKTHVERYENGERYVNGRWMSAEKEAEIRRDFHQAWEIRTDHYLIKTNHSLERGVELGRALEEFFDVFFQTFAGFFNTPEQLKKMFDGSGGPRNNTKPYVVHYYRTREEYLERLRSRIPQIDITNGLYMTSDRIAYFYHDPAADNHAALFHEATHQLFYESQPSERDIAADANFWLIEGIACYMESYRKQDGQLTLGDPRYIRFEAARYRLLNDHYYVPLAQFAAMGAREFQTSPNISRNYSQASGLCHFFMHSEGGEHRDALVRQLVQLYSADIRTRSHVQTLAELCGVDFAELDRQYAEHLRSLESQVRNKDSTDQAGRPR